MRSFRLLLGLGVASLSFLAAPWDAQACHRHLHSYYDGGPVAVSYGPVLMPAYTLPPPPRAASTIPVGIYDNYFLPTRIDVWQGMTLRWTNHGQHQHTVTATDGSWGSEKLGHDESYSYTFTRPGVYYFYCQLHPQQMRGMVIVR
jgi:plastocyanin